LKVLGFPAPIRDLLADRKVIKTGVAVRDDIAGLKKLTPFSPGSFIDLGEVARKRNIPTRGLRTIAANFLSFRLSKGAQRSNWGATRLDAKQQTYAATDAWVSREIHLKFEELGML
jgi:ribonuclease D